jgi:hypothetical protein
VRTPPLNRAGLTRLAVAVLRLAEEDLDHGDPFLTSYAEDFLFGDDEMPLMRWLLLTGCVDFDAFRDGILRKRKKLAA